MWLSKEEELVAVASALYLVGLEVDATSETLMQLYESGISLSDPKMLKANTPYNRACLEFGRLEEHYIVLHAEMQEAEREAE